jgi:N-methylhydantoinase A
VDVRYRGQGYELTIPLTRNLLEDFKREHQRRYGYTHANREIELVTLRLRAILKSPTGQLGPNAFVQSSTAKTRTRPAQTKTLFDGKKLETRVYAREELQPGKGYSGPAVVTEYSATTVIPPGSRFYLDRAANLIISPNLTQIFLPSRP